MASRRAQDHQIRPHQPPRHNLGKELSPSTGTKAHHGNRRVKPMRADIIPGAVFPDYELSDHTTTRRKLSELQGHTPWCSSLAVEASAPKAAASTNSSSSFTARWR